MKTITSKSPHGSSSFSFSRRYFNLKKKVEYDDDDDEEDEEEEEEILTTFGSSSNSSSRYFCEEELGFARHQLSLVPSLPTPRKHLQLPTPATVAVSKLRSALGVFAKNLSSSNRGSGSGLGTKVIGTLFGYRRGHVHFAFQEGAKSSPAFLIQLATPTSVLVREMASGLVRVALECDKTKKKKKKAGAGAGGRVKLLEEPVWRTYCNGKKCGFAVRRECGEEEWKVFKALEPISMGAGVLPLPLTLPPAAAAAASACNIGNGNGNGWEQLGELMYMRARFERVVGSKDSEAFYMMNPDGSGGPELSVYLLRV